MDRDEHRIEILAEWLLEVMRRKGLSAAGWARSAGCADTTISRFLKQRRHGLRRETVQALAQAAGVEPPALDLALRSIPLVDASARLQALAARRQELLRELRHVDQMIAAQANDFIEAHRRQSQALGLIAAGGLPEPASTSAGSAPALLSPRAAAPPRPVSMRGEAQAARATEAIRRSRDRIG